MRPHRAMMRCGQHVRRRESFRLLLVRCHTSESERRKKNFWSVDDPGSRITAVGAVMNFILGGFKVGVGSICASPALVADGVHSFSDLVTDVVSVATFKFARMPPDDDHTWGHGKLEAVGTIAVGSTLVALAGGMALHSSAVLLNLVGLEQSVSLLSLDNVYSVHQPAIFGEYGSVTAATTALGAIIAKEWLYRETKRIGERIHSSVLIANAHHHRSDALSSVASLLGVATAATIHPACDPAAGLLVAVAIGKAGLDLTRDAMNELLDATDPKLIRILKTAIVNLPGARLTTVRARTSGGLLLVDADLAVASISNSTLSASAAFHLSQHASKKMREAARKAGFYIHDIRLIYDPRPTAWLHDSTELGDHFAAPSNLDYLPSPHDLEHNIFKSVAHFYQIHRNTYPSFIGLNDLILHYAPHEEQIRAKLDLSFHTLKHMPHHDLLSLATSLRHHLQSQVPLLTSIEVSTTILSSSSSDPAALAKTSTDCSESYKAAGTK